MIELTPKEQKRIKDFIQEHKDCIFTSSIGGKISYIVTPTGIGSIIEVRCNACGKQKDITDIDCW